MGNLLRKPRNSDDRIAQVKSVLGVLVAVLGVSNILNSICTNFVSSCNKNRVNQFELFLYCLLFCVGVTISILALFVIEKKPAPIDLARMSAHVPEETYYRWSAVL